MTNIIDARDVGKYYGAVTALEGANFHIGSGEIVGFAGDNGAGKSTLMRAVSGDVTPSVGEVLINGIVPQGYSPKKARQLGIEMVYQDLALCENLDIYENIFLGRELRRFGAFGVNVIDRKAMLKRSANILVQLELELPSLTEPVSALSGGQRQLVAIARAMGLSPILVIMDEPTASLSVKAARPLLELIRRLPRSGASVMLVSHRLSDLMETTDRIYILRRGSIAGELITKDTSETEILHAMAGVSDDASRSR
jgi:simple sugar transport system ATP-binding protein/D-xylose transport system ATP-binding protein